MKRTSRVLSTTTRRPDLNPEEVVATGLGFGLLTGRFRMPGIYHSSGHLPM